MVNSFHLSSVQQGHGVSGCFKFHKLLALKLVCREQWKMLLHHVVATNKIVLLHVGVSFVVSERPDDTIL